MSDERMRGLQRAAADGDRQAKNALLRAQFRARRCIDGCNVSYAGQVSDELRRPHRYVWRTACWTCGDIRLVGDVHDPEMTKKARRAWGDDLGHEKLFDCFRGAYV